eukprot:707189_1
MSVLSPMTSAITAPTDGIVTRTKSLEICSAPEPTFKTAARATLEDHSSIRKEVLTSKLEWCLGALAVPPTTFPECMLEYQGRTIGSRAKFVLRIRVMLFRLDLIADCVSFDESVAV